MDQNSLNNDVDSFSDQPIKSAISDCLYASFVVMVRVSLLLMNALLCLTIYGAIPKSDSDEAVARIGQLFFFIAPVILLLVEWNLMDRLQRLFRIRT